MKLPLFFSLLLAAPLFAETTGVYRPAAPKHVRAERQDAQAARVTWDSLGNNVSYHLYASYDKEPRAFHCENNCGAIHETFAIWDAPRDGSRRFAFYVTAVDKKGRESQPSSIVAVDLSAKK